MEFAGNATDALRLALALALPALLVSLLVGLALAWFEVLARGQDASIGFVPRLLAVAIAVFIGRDFIGGELMKFTTHVLRELARTGH